MSKIHHPSHFLANQSRLLARHAGFTFIELMTVVLIVGVVTAIALPSFRSILNSMRTSSEAGALYSAITFARQEARKRGTIVSIAPPTGQANLTNGWVIFVDPTNSRSQAAAIAGQGYILLAQHDDVPANMNITVNMGCNGLPNTLSFDRFGDCGNNAFPAFRVMVGFVDPNVPTQFDRQARRAICLSDAGRLEIRNPKANVLDADACAN